MTLRDFLAAYRPVFSTPKKERFVLVKERGTSKTLMHGDLAVDWRRYNSEIYDRIVVTWLSREMTRSSFVLNKTDLEAIKMFKKEFIAEAKALYPTWSDLHKAIENGSRIIDRYLDDSTPTSINYREILAATSLDELKREAMIIKRKNDLLDAYRSGSCYQTESERRENMGCPRLYAQMTDDDAALGAFHCSGVFHIPSCPKFSSGECWKRFDELGLKMKKNIL